MTLRRLTFQMSEEHAVSLKLPTFWSSQPEVWFAQAEAQFNLRKITADDTKYYYVLAALDQPTATRLLDLISHPPADDKYEALKTRLIDTFGLSERERASRLLHFRELGDTKPSVLMDEMLALLGDHSPCFLFQQLFFERLPEDIRVQLVDSTADDYRHLAKKADALWASREMSFSTNAVQRRLSSQKLRAKHPTTPTADDLCYYHRSFGQAARKCTKPCSWSGKEQAIVAMAASHNTGLFFLWDKISGRQFLVDTGAEISVIPATASDKRNTHDKQGPLHAVSGQWYYNQNIWKSYRACPSSLRPKGINGVSPLRMCLALYWEQIFYEQTPL